MIQKDTMYIVSSSQQSTIKKILSEKLALLYGNFEVVEVAGFDNKTALAFLEENLGSISLPRDYIDYLIDFADGNPFYLDVLSKKIIEITNSEKFLHAGEKAVIEAFTATIYNTSGTISQYFTNNIMNLLERGFRDDYLDILIALACGAKKLGEIAAWFKKKSCNGFSNKLSRLIELDMVYKNGVFYELHDRVFEFWLRTVYHERKTSLVDDIVSRANDFRKEVKSDIDEYICESRRSVLERVKELFNLFNGEKVEIRKKERRLPRFARIEVRRYGNCDDILTEQKPGKYWVCELWQERLEEHGISDFIERYRPMRDKIIKKICVALKGIGENALLLAKEKNIWVWDLKSINSLLGLYKKHKLVCK